MQMREMETHDEGEKALNHYEESDPLQVRERK